MIECDIENVTTLEPVDVEIMGLYRQLVMLLVTAISPLASPDSISFVMVRRNVPLEGLMK